MSGKRFRIIIIEVVFFLAEFGANIGPPITNERLSPISTVILCPVLPIHCSNSKHTHLSTSGLTILCCTYITSGDNLVSWGVILILPYFSTKQICASYSEVIVFPEMI